MTVYQYCNKCKTEVVHKLENSIIECAKCKKKTKLEIKR
jgi:ribosomal protein L37AE/L43A